MLATMRVYSKSWAVKALFIFLAVVFAVWGIGDIFRGTGKQVVAKVGNREISYYQFRSSLDRRVDQLRQAYGNAVTLASLKQSGEDRNILEQMINDELIKQRIRNLKISVGDDVVKSVVLENKVFYDESGKFSKDIYSKLLKSNGLNQDKYVEAIRNDKSVAMFLSSFNVTMPVGNVYTDPLILHRFEQRQADLVVIPSNYVKTISEPSDTELVQFYNNNGAKFALPELRRISYIKFDPTIVNKSIAVTNEELSKEYNNRKSEFLSEEARNLDQYLFSNESSAKAAYQDILNKKAITGKIDLGIVTKSTLPNELREKVFALAKNTTSEPIKSTLGWHIFVVKEILPSRQKTFTEVKDQLKNDLEQNKANDSLYKFTNDMETQLSEGKTLDEIAKNFNLKVMTIEPISKDGYSSSGVKVAIPDPGLLLPLIFKQELDIESAVVTLSENNGYVVFKVGQIIPSRVKALDEVKGLASQLLKQDKMAHKLKDIAKEWADKIAKDPKEFSKLKLESSIKTYTNQAVKRFSNSPLSTTPKQEYPEGFINQLFSLKNIGSSTEAHIMADGSYLIAQLQNIKKIDKNTSNEYLSGLKEEMRNEFLDDIIVQYIYYLRSIYPVKVNEDLINSAITTESN